MRYGMQDGRVVRRRSLTNAPADLGSGDEGLIPDNIERGLKIGSGWVLALAAVLLLGIGVTTCAKQYYARTTTKVTVISKENVCGPSGDGKTISCSLMVFTDARAYEVRDAIFGAERFDSLTVYGRIQVGKVYCITSYGWDVAWADMYENIERYYEPDLGTGDC